MRSKTSNSTLGNNVKASQRDITPMLFSALGFLSLLIFSSVSAASIELSKADRTSLSISIYNQNLALINEVRAAKVPQGNSELNFQGVSPLINAPSAIVRNPAKNSRVLAQNYRPTILSSDLMRSAVGKEITLLSTHPVTGVQTRERAKLISVNGGVILEINDHFETDLAGRRVLFDALPAGELSPSLRVDIQSKAAAETEFILSYLSGGLSWQADYVAALDADKKQLDLTALASLKNQSGVNFNNAKLSLIAGTINQAQNVMRKQRGMVMMAAPMESDVGVPSVPLGDLHVYHLPQKVDLADKVSQQITLFEAHDVAFTSRYELAGQAYLFYSSSAPEQKLKIDRYLEFDNKKQANLGLPMPAGVVRVYQQSAENALQFTGEDRITHTAKGETLRIKTGQAFDLHARKKQLSYRRLPVQQPYRNHAEVEIETTLQNAKDEAVIINVQEALSGKWKLIKGPEPDTSSAGFASWAVKVPANGEAVLRVTIQIKS